MPRAITVSSLRDTATSGQGESETKPKGRAEPLALGLAASMAITRGAAPSVSMRTVRLNSGALTQAVREQVRQRDRPERVADSERGAPRRRGRPSDRQLIAKDVAAHGVREGRLVPSASR